MPNMMVVHVSGATISGISECLNSAELNKIFPLRKMAPGVLLQIQSNPDSLSLFFQINKSQLN